MNSPAIMAKLGTIFLTWRRYQQRGVLPHKITLKQLYLLRKLVDNEFLLPSEIASLLYCDRPTATVVIRNMAREGWVYRQKDPENARQIRVLITEKGREKLQKVEDKQPHDNGPGFDPLACFSDEEKAQLDSLLSKLKAHMKKIEQE